MPLRLCIFSEKIKKYIEEFFFNFDHLKIVSFFALHIGISGSTPAPHFEFLHSKLAATGHTPA
jgi:Mn2+/Fe2+ NRAMP family transporter